MLAYCLINAAALPAWLCGAGPPPEPPPVPAVWLELAVCESGINGKPRWDYNGPSGFDGGLQFHPMTWTEFGGQGYAHEASPAEQVAVAELVLESQGWGAWPACSEKLGYR